MATLTLTLPEQTKQEFKSFAWVNWSELAREEVIKKLILEHYLKTGTITDEEWFWCEQNDWHPVDELPFKKEFLEKMKKIKTEKSTKRQKPLPSFFSRHHDEV